MIDINNINILDKNIEVFENNDRIKEVILIPQVKNLEDELIYSTKIKKRLTYENISNVGANYLK